jgi:hypothetical protein
MTPKERRTHALIRRLPAGEHREFLESMMPPRKPAAKRFREYAQRAEKELMAWELNWMSSRMAGLLDGCAGTVAVSDEVKTEKAERKRAKERLKLVRRRKLQ